MLVMNDLKRVALLAAGAILAGAGVVRAADGSSDFTLSPAPSKRPIYAAAPAPPPPTHAATEEPTLLQSKLTQYNAGGQWLEQNAIRVGGYAEAGYVYNFVHPGSGFNGYGFLFPDKEQDLTLDQISLFVARDALVGPDRFDLGFKVQVIYGADARYTQANGTNFYGSRWAQDLNPGALPTVSMTGPGFPLPNAGQHDPENQIDFLQGYITANLPVGNGLLITAGKFVTPWGLETIDPTQNLLYTHSFTFALAIPRTLTGATATYRLNDEWSFMGGMVVGWNQAFEDNNDFPSFVAQASWAYSPEWDFVASVIAGPEETSNRSDFRWTLDLTAKWKMSDTSHLGFEALLGYEPDVGSHYLDINVGGPNFTALFPTGKDSLWFGGVIEGDYRLDEDGIWTLVFRGEYFNDANGGRGLATEVWSGTMGVNIVPFPKDEYGKNFMIRPEIRYDYALDTVFDDNNRTSQITLSADLIYKF
jgi:hypothetical protein